MLVSDPRNIASTKSGYWNCIAFDQVLLQRPAGVLIVLTFVYCVFTLFFQYWKCPNSLSFVAWERRQNNSSVVVMLLWFERKNLQPEMAKHLCDLEMQVSNNSGMIVSAFTLQKENLETLEAISFLATELGVLPSDFSYTGIKDKKAITYQLMVVKKVTPERLKEIESKLEKKGMRIHNIHSAHQHLRLGQLKGNHFDIVVRDLRHHSHDSPVDLKERISEAMENIEAKGFVNYYGPQRFGQGQNVQTDEIGLALLNEKMVKAVKLFFTPEDTDDPVNNAKRYFLQTEDAKGALTMLPEFKVRERMLLRALHRYGVNQEGCTKGWLSIPHSMRIFYVHAYCSQIWNEATSYRLKTYGSRVVEGDLVFSEENDESLSLSDKVHTVTALEESANKYSIHQVVLPMVGHSIKYPSNKVGQWYHERLSKDELQMCKFRVPPLQLNIPGCYRHILKNVRNLSYFLEGSEEGSKIEHDHLNESEVSLHISFDLDPSCYATVCLREIMKCDF